MARRTGRTVVRFSDLAQPAEVARESKAAAAADFLRSVLANAEKPVPIVAVVDRCRVEGFGRRTTERAAKLIGVESERIPGSTGRTWCLPTG
jgi:hypothetical protein